jgi:hypothetical protein
LRDWRTAGLVARTRPRPALLVPQDFARITTEWAAAGRSHAGCLLIVGIDHAEFGLILRVIEHAISTRSDQAAWIDYTAWGTRSAVT